MQRISLMITSTIHSVGEEIPQVIEQDLAADLLEIEDEWQLYYIEGGKQEQSRVRIFSYPDQLIVLRQGTIHYQQVYQVGETTLCQMNTPTGLLELHVTTHAYQRNKQNIDCQFTISQANFILGEYRLQLKW